MTDVILEPCDFVPKPCGANAAKVIFTGIPENATDFIVECQDCGHRGPTCDTEAEAVTAWNTRVNKGPAADALVEAVRSVLLRADALDRAALPLDALEDAYDAYRESVS